jgi:hypothetical protein
MERRQENGHVKQVCFVARSCSGLRVLGSINLIFSILKHVETHCQHRGNCTCDVAALG